MAAREVVAGFVREAGHDSLKEGMTPLPREPNGTSHLVQTIRQLIRRSREQEIIADRETMEIKKTANGTIIKAKGKKGGTTDEEGSSSTPRWG